MNPPDLWTAHRLRTAVASVEAAIGPVDDHRQVAELETAARANPRDRTLHLLTLRAHQAAAAGAGLPQVVAGVHRETLLAWDVATSTWLGRDVASGRPARVRALDAAASEPWRRALDRDGRALDGLIPGLRREAGALAVVLDASGEEPAPLAGIAQALNDIQRWAALGLGAPPHHPAPFDIIDGRLCIVTLTPAAHDPRLLIGAAADWLGARRPPGDHLAATIAAWSPGDPSETGRALARYLAADLAARWTRLRVAYESAAHASRAERLRDAVLRLTCALGPPEGRAAVSIDLDGNITIATAADGVLSWGPHDAQAVVAGPDVFDKVAARRLLRARAASPPSPRLQREVSGDDDALDHITRWLAAAARLYTVRRLIRQPAG